MNRFALIEGLESRQFFSVSGLADRPAPPPPPEDGGAVRQPRRRPEGPGADGDAGGEGSNPGTTTGNTAAAPVAFYTGTLTTEEGDVRRFCLAVLTDTGTAVTASIPGREGGVQLTGTHTGDTYTLTSGDGEVTLTATVDSAGKVTGTLVRTETEDGATETHTATLALATADPAKAPPLAGDEHHGPRGGDKPAPGGDKPAPGGDDDDDGAPVVTPIAFYAGTITLTGGTSKRFALSILTDANGAVTASIPGRGKSAQLTGTHTGNTYTLASAGDGPTINITATVDNAGNVTGTFSCTGTNREGEAVTQTGTLALAAADPTAAPTGGHHLRPALVQNDLTTYTGTIASTDRTADVVVQTYTDADGVTKVLIASKKCFGLRPAILTSTVNGDSITASASNGDRGISVAFTVGTDGALTGTVTLTHGDVTRTLTITATEKVTTTT